MYSLFGLVTSPSFMDIPTLIGFGFIANLVTLIFVYKTGGFGRSK